MNTTKKISSNDSLNQIALDKIIKKHGWPEKEKISQKANRATSLIILHRGLSYQKRYEDLIRLAFEENKIDGQDLTMFSDRLLMRKVEPQIYGTQLTHNKQEEKWELYPLKDESKVNEWRKSIGLIAVEEYLKLNGIK